MRFTASREELAAAVATAASGVPASPVRPVYASVHLRVDEDRAHFTGTDGDVTFTGSCEATVGEPGETLLPGKLLASAARAIAEKKEEDVSFASEHQGMHIFCGGLTFALLASRDPWPSLPAPATARAASVEGAELAAAIRRAVPAVSRTDATLAALRLEPQGDVLRIVATDRYRLHAVEVPWEPGDAAGPCLLAGREAERFCRALQGEARISWDDRVVTLESGDSALTSRLISGKYLKYERLLTGADPDIALETATLTAAVRRARMAAEASDETTVTLAFSFGRLQALAGAAGSSSAEEIDISYDGPEFSATVATEYLLAALAGCDEECRTGFEAGKLRIYSGSARYVIQHRRGK